MQDVCCICKQEDLKTFLEKLTKAGLNTAGQMHLYPTESLSGQGGDPGYVICDENSCIEVRFDWLSEKHPHCFSALWCLGAGETQKSLFE